MNALESPPSTPASSEGGPGESRCPPLSPLFVAISHEQQQLAPELAGAKAAELSRMTRLGLRVPPAFVLPTSLCGPINAGDSAASDALRQGLRDGIAALEAATGRRFGDDRAPLLVSVRSGAAISMPGMLSTVLNVGLNEGAVHGLIGLTGNPRLAWDSYFRFIRMYADVVGGAPAENFSPAMEAMVRSEAVRDESDLDPEALERLAHELLPVAERASVAIPADPFAQLECAARAVYLSWEGERAKEYRRLNDIDGLAGTAVTVQAMVFGNAGGKSGAGVAFSRNPATGAKELYVDFLFDAQGEDVVSGRRMPGDAGLLGARLPGVARELGDAATRLERELLDVQDIEFTVEDGRLWFLQTRPAKRTARAALRILVDLVREDIIDRDTALQRVRAIDLAAANLTRFADSASPIATAVSAAPGVACGRIALDAAHAMNMAQRGEPVILVRREPTTNDIAGMSVAQGLLTMVGARTAHAAVVARQMGKVCLVGCRELAIEDGCAFIAGQRLGAGDWISIDGDKGEVTLGRREIVTELPKEQLSEIAAWSRQSGSSPDLRQA